jgi:polyhydroxyalkanoate synthesis regulator phasin
LTERREEASDRGVGDALRDAIERTLQATAGSAASVTRERAGELVDELARRGREARGELTRRGQAAGAELARRGQGAGAELGKRLEALERRLAEVEEGLRREAEGAGDTATPSGHAPDERLDDPERGEGQSHPEAEG